MFDASKLNKAFRSLDSAMVVTALGKDDLRDPVAAGKFVRALRESSCLALQIANATKETASVANATKAYSHMRKRVGTQKTN